MITVTCAIIICNNLVLATQRSETMKLPLKWEFPGGKLERAEDPTQCIIREIKEELNIEIDVAFELPPSEFDYGPFAIRLLPFVSKYRSGEIILAEHKAHKWLRPEELGTLDWAEADVPVVQEFLNYYLDAARDL